MTSGLWRDTVGDGVPVVLVHGTMDRSASFGRVVRALDGYQVTRYDRRGYGRSLALGPPADVDDQVADLLDVIDGRPSLVFGHSYGGTVALATAARHPDAVIGLVAYECPLPWMSWWPTDSAGSAAIRAAATPEAAAERFMIRMVGERRWQRLPPSTRRARRAEGPTLVAELAQLRPPHPPALELGDVTVPVIAAHGTDGADHHHRSAVAVADGVADGVLHVVEGATHGVHLSHPGAVAALIDDLATRCGLG